MPTKERYINLFTDYGFKKIFGEEPNKNLLLDSIAELARFTPDQERSHEKNLKYYRDLKNSLDTAKEEGRISGQLKMAKGLLAQEMSVSEIVAISDLTVEQIKGLLD